MPNLTIKGIPEDVHRELKEAAKAEGQSLNAYIVEFLTRMTDERERRKLMWRGSEEFRKFLATLPPVGDSVELLREDRERNR